MTMTRAVLVRPTILQIRNKRIEMMAEWTELNGGPCETFVHRAHDVVLDCKVATITCRSSMPNGFRMTEVQSV